MKRNKGTAALCILVFLSVFCPVSAGYAFSENEVKLVFTGDIMVHDLQNNLAYSGETGSYDFSPSFEEVSHLLKGDLVVGNLETVFAGPSCGYSGYPKFNTPDDLAENLKEAGFDFLFTANNHCLDQGITGLERTVSVLDRAGIAHTGTCLFPDDSGKGKIIEIKGYHIGFLNYTYGVNGNYLPGDREWSVSLLYKRDYASEIEVLAEKTDFLVVGVHFGTEYTAEPSVLQKETAVRMLDAGADAVIGGHPHVLQPFYFSEGEGKTGFTVYSTGNFISSQKGRYRTSGAVLSLILRENPDGILYPAKAVFSPVAVIRGRDSGGKYFLRLVPAESGNGNVGTTGLALAAAEEDVRSMWKDAVSVHYLENLVYSLGKAAAGNF